MSETKIEQHTILPYPGAFVATTPALHGESVLLRVKTHGPQFWLQVELNKKSLTPSELATREPAFQKLVSFFDSGPEYRTYDTYLHLSKKGSSMAADPAAAVGFFLNMGKVDFVGAEYDEGKGSAVIRLGPHDAVEKRERAFAISISLKPHSDSAIREIGSAFRGKE
jgi:hypothetical protein